MGQFLSLPEDHEQKTHIFEGNALSYVQELRGLNWPKEMIRKAAEFYEIKEVVAALDLDGRIG